MTTEREDPTGDRSGRTIKWDGSNLKTSRPDAFHAAYRREDICLFFGTAAERTREENDPAGRLECCIILTPVAARNLGVTLDRVVRHAETGRTHPEFRPTRFADPARSASGEPVVGSTEEARERSRFLFHQIRDLSAQYGLERSVKFLDRALLWNRFLAGVDKKSIGNQPDERILELCARIGMPDNLLGSFRKNLPDVNFVLFGFEENRSTCVYKVYLEYYDRFTGHMPDGRTTHDPFLLHLGFKWDAMGSDRNALTRYTWHPLISMQDIDERMAGIYDGSNHGISLEIAKGIVARAAGRMSYKDCLYLEVNEDGNTRSSFDINLYQADLRLKDLETALFEICRHYSIPPAEFRPLYEGVADGIVGHLAGGIDGQGRDFLTLYYEPVSA